MDNTALLTLFSPVVGIGRNEAHALDDIHAVTYATEDCVLAIEKRRRCEGDEL